MLLRQGAFCGYSLLHVIPKRHTSLHVIPKRRTRLHVIPKRHTSLHIIPKRRTSLHVIPKRHTSREGSPRLLQPVPCKGIPRFADFAPLGLVRRFVEMLLQAGISPRVGRNDEEQSLL